MRLQLGTPTTNCLKTLQVRIIKGRGQMILCNVNLNTLVNMIRVQKPRTSRKYLTIDIMEHREISSEPMGEKKILKLNIILMMKKSQEFWVLSSGKTDFHRLARPRNVNADLKHDILCL